MTLDGSSYVYSTERLFSTLFVVVMTYRGIINMLVVGLIFLGTIALGELANYASHRRAERRRAQRNVY